jgi:hypothetical protein
MKNFVVKLSGVAIFCLALVAGLHAQNTSGTISGTVKDKSGAVIPNVTVTATNEATNVTNTVSTNDAGAYSFLSLPVGKYDVAARQTGFTEYKQIGITLDVNDHIVVDIGMEVGAVTQTVEVSANAAHVETSSATLGDVIGGKSIVDQPLVNRSYIDLMGLQAGVNPSTNQTGTVSGDLSAGNISVSGSRTDANGFTVNGGNVEEGEGNGTGIIPNADSIAEFRIITNSANAEYGHYSGGAVNVITKSGANSFHGDGFEFWRNQSLDAITPFATAKPAYSHNEFGGTLGGPIKKNRLFFFGDYQGNRETTGVVESTEVPTNAEITGNLSDRAGNLTGSVSSNAFAAQLTSQLGYTVTAGEPYYTSGCASTTTCVFPNALIAPSKWAPPVAHLLKYLPATNTTISGIPEWQGTSGNSLVHDNKGSGRVDATTGIGQLSVYYFIDNSSTTNPYGSGDVPGFATQTPARAQQLNFGDTKTFGGNQLNDLRLNYTRLHHFSGEAVGGIGPTFQSLGFVAGGNGLVAVDPSFEGVPLISTNEWNFGESGGQTQQTDNTFQWNDSYSIIHGTHQFKFGGEGNYVQIIERRITDPNGAFDFSGGNETGDDLADFLIGAVNTFTQSSNQLLDSRAWYAGAFAQDTWRIKPSFTLNYGLRQDISTFFYDTQNKIQSIVPGLASQVYPGAPTGWVFPGDPGVPRTLAPTHYNNFAPRVAIAYSPNFTDGPLAKIFGGSGQTAIRAAWGIFYTVVDDSTLFDEVADAPFGLYWQQNNVQFATPWVQMNGIVSGQHFPFTNPPPGDKNIDWSFFEPIASSPGIAITDRLPYTEEYNFTIERQVSSGTVATVAYVGSQAHRLLSSVEANPGIPSICTYLSVKANVQKGTDTCGPGNENDVFTLPNAAGTVCTPSSPAGAPCIFGTRLPLGINFSEGDQLWTTVGRSTYNSLQATLKHTGKRYTLLAAYTWSKSMDTGSSNGAALDPLPNPLPALPSPLPSNLFTPTPPTVTTFGAPDYNHFWSLSSFDLPQNFVASYSYNLPFDKLTNRFSRLTNGWVIAGTTRLAKGTPIGVSYSTDNSYLGAFSNDYPNFNGGNVSHLNPRDLATNPKRYWIGCPKAGSGCSTGVYSAEPLGQIGNAMRDFVIGPGWNNTDMSLIKNVTITGERQLQFRIDAFNVFNHTQFKNPSGSFTSGSFMRITGANPARIAQLGVKFIF